MSAEFVYFVLIGALSATLNVALRALFSLIVPFEIAIVLAFPIALTTAFILNKVLVFRFATGLVTRQYVKFLFVNLMALVQIWIVSVGLARFVFPAMNFEWHLETVAHICGVISPIFTSYLGHKYLSFRQ